MEPFDLNAIEVNVEIDQSDSPVHIIWNDGRVFIAVGHGKTTRRSLICDNGIWSIVSVKK